MDLIHYTHVIIKNMNTHLIKIKYKNSKYPVVFMAKSFSRKEILDISEDICKIFDNVYYNELQTTFICKERNNINKIMKYLINKFVY